MKELSPAARQRAGELSDVFNDLSRRQFVRGGLAGGAGAALAASAAAGVGPGAGQNPLAPDDKDDLRTLLHHATQGYSGETYADAATKGYESWLNEQLMPWIIPDPDVALLLGQLPTLTMSGQELWDNYVDPVYDPTIPILELRFANLIRSLWSKHQLYERVVEFWTDHFNIFQADFGPDILKTVDDRDVIRSFAFGKFRDLLHASAKSGAMIWYLDNIVNFVGAPNENYAREFFELHTLGVNGGYDEDDIKEFARCLTGWNIKYPDTQDYGEFRFYPTLHDLGAKTVLGLNIPAGGHQEDVEMVIDHVADHPSTIDFVSRKLVSWLLVNDPPESVVQDVKDAWIAHDGLITELVRAALSPKSILAARAGTTTKVRRPYHFMIGLLRSTYGQVSDLLPMMYQLSVMGQGPYEWHPPNGYPDAVGAWAPGLHPRWLVASAYFDSYFPGLLVSDLTLLQLVGGDLGAPDLAQRIDVALTGGTMTQDDVAELQTWLDPQNPSTAVLREAFALAASSPSFQQY